MAVRRALWLSVLRTIALQPHVPPLRSGEPATLELKSLAKPVSDDEMFALCSQIVQYKLLEDLRDNQSVSGSRPTVVDGHQIPSFFAPAPAGPIVDYPADKVRELLSCNRFHSPTAFLWQHRTLRVPPKARIFLRHIPSSESTGVMKDLIVVERLNYFRAVVTIEPLGAGGTGKSSVKTVRVAVSMQASLFKLAAGSTYSTQVKDWADWLFKMFEARNVT